jgi:hypothetical protein
MIFKSAAVAAALLPLGMIFTGCDRARSAAESAPAPAVEVRPPAPAAPATLPSAVPYASPHFNHVMGKVDVGGKVLHFEDHAGKRDWMVQLVRAVLDGVPEAKALGPIDPGALVDSLGLADAAASAKSLRKDGDSWLMRRYTYLPKGSQGFSNLMGKEPFEFRSPALIPAATDLVVETRIDATTLPALIQRVAKACGQEAAASKFLSEPLPIGANLEALLSMTDLHLILGADISSWQATPTSPQPVDFFVQIMGGKDLMPLLLPTLEQALGKPRPIANRNGWEIPLPPLRQPRALLLYEEGGTLIMSSREDYLKYVETAAMKLGQWKEYTAATDHFPAKGNLLVYASPQVPPAIAWALRIAAKNISEEGAPVITKAADYLEPRAWSLCIAHEAEGIATVAEMPFAADVEMASALPVLTGTSMLFVGARAWKRGSDRAACIMNMRNTQQAIRAYQAANSLKPGDPIPWERIYSKSLKKPVCPDGGKYTFSKTIPKTGGLACECEHKEHLPAQDSYQDW